GAAAARGPVGHPEGDVAGDAQVREQRALLGHDADAAPFGRDVRPGTGEQAGPDGDGPGVGAQEPRDDAQEGGLAAAGRAEPGGEGAAGDGEVEPVEDGGVRAVRLGEALDPQFGHERCLPRRYEGTAASRMSAAAYGAASA